MKEIISELTKALEKLTINENDTAAEALIEQLQVSNYTWVSDLPISIVHREKKLKADTVRNYLLANDFFDNTGSSDTVQGLQKLERMAREMRKAFQTIDLAALESHAAMDKLTFQNKRPNDFWKRLKNANAVKALVGLQYVDSSDCSDDFIKAVLQETINGQWPVESALRDAIRSTKENSALRSKPFVWVVIQTQTDQGDVDNVAKMLRHYFGANVVEGRGNVHFYIGCMDELNAISLREFYKKA